MSDEIKLLPCPFCGRVSEDDGPSPEHIGRQFLVSCGSCGVQTDTAAAARTATALWNMRAVPELSDEDKVAVNDIIQHFSRYDPTGITFNKILSVMHRQGFAVVRVKL